MRQAGAEDFWRTYVSFDPRTSIAHGLPTLRRVQESDLVMIDLHPDSPPLIRGRSSFARKSSRAQRGGGLGRAPYAN